jgi:hypothetical protein
MDTKYITYSPKIFGSFIFIQKKCIGLMICAALGGVMGAEE